MNLDLVVKATIDWRGEVGRGAKEKDYREKTWAERMRGCRE